MEKLKLKIKGMHCVSCSSLIETELKDRDGVVMPKVNHESGKAVIVFDKDKISEGEIIRAIEKTGDYEVKKIEENKDTDEILTYSTKEEESTDNLLINPMLLGFCLGVGSLSIIINIILVTILFKS